MIPVLIIGAGPAGLAASKCLADLHVSHHLIDRHGQSGGAYRRMYSRTQLSSPPRYLRLPGARPPEPSTGVLAHEYALYLESYAREHGLHPVRREVTYIDRSGSSFNVTFADQSRPEQYIAVIVCTGSFDNPYIPVVRGLTDDGESRHGAIAVIHAAHWPGAEAFRGKRLLIIGDRITAVELIEECVCVGLRPLLSAKTRPVKLYPLKIMGLNARHFVYPFMRSLPLSWFRTQCDRGWRYRGVDRGFRNYVLRRLVDVRPMVKHCSGNEVVFEDSSVASIDAVVFATGYRFYMPFLPREVSRTAQGVPVVRRGESVDWPRLFVLGVPCAFAGNSHFVFGIATDAHLIAKKIQTVIYDDPPRDIHASTSSTD